MSKVDSNGRGCVRCVVSGRVQGVFYRASTRRQAESLNVTGWARNLPDGRVEVVACGTQAALAELQAWLRQGPPAAEVRSIACEVIPDQQTAGFTTG